MKFDSASDLFFIVSVLVPGFIYYSVLSTFVPQRDSSGRETILLRLFVGTALNYGLCSPLIYLLITEAIFQDSPVWRGVIWLIIIFAAPIAVALIAARMSQARFVRFISDWLGLRSISPITTGWDWIFGLQDTLYVLVTLKDGTKLAGFFGTESMASSDPTRKDLYLEKAYVVPDEGAWQEVPGTRGIYVDGAEVAFIEFKV